MPFTPQKKDRGKPGFWPKPSPRAPGAVPGPAVSLQLVERPATSAATSAATSTATSTATSAAAAASSQHCVASALPPGPHGEAVPLAQDGGGQGRSQAVVLQPHRAWVWAAWEREEFKAISAFLPWRAMRLTDISECLLPECCDKTKPALTGTCSLLPSWSLICHC